MTTSRKSIRHRPFKDGNRLPLPKAMQEAGFKHFFYKTKPYRFSPDVLEPLTAEARAYYLDRKLGPQTIEVLSHCGEAATRSLEQVKASLGFVETDPDPDIVLCQMALPHEDAMFAGQVFASLVVHTGDAPYLMTTLHTMIGEEYGEPCMQLVEQTRELRVGDFVVFDPTTPHYAVPKFSNNNAFLVLAQFELTMRTPAQQAALLKRFPPAPDEAKHNEDD